MAGDWIAIDHELAESPQLLGILEKTGEEIGTIIGRLVLLWTLADRQTVDGVLKNAGVRSISRVCGGSTEFWQAVAEVGWIVIHDGCVEIPKFNDRFGKSARKRMLDAKRQVVKRGNVARQRDGLATDERQNADELATPESESESESKIPDSSGRASGVFEKVRKETLEDPRALNAWFDFAASRHRPVVRNTEADRLSVFGAAVRSLRVGKSPLKLFATIVGKRQFNLISQEEERIAAQNLKQLRAQPPPKSPTEPQDVISKSIAGIFGAHDANGERTGSASA